MANFVNIRKQHTKKKSNHFLSIQIYLKLNNMNEKNAKMSQNTVVLVYRNQIDFFHVCSAVLY